MDGNRIVIGTRKSQLAMVQADLVKKRLREVGYAGEILIHTYVTSGDRILDRPLDEIGGKGLFVRELDLALASGEIDFAVHSLKDFPMEENPELPLRAFLPRASAADVLVLPQGVTSLDLTCPIGCSSKRRTLQLQALYPEAMVSSVRGNVPTRLEKLDRGEYGALVLAEAGLTRLGLEDRISRTFLSTEMVPAAGQGILAIQTRAGSAADAWALRCMDAAARDAALCERAFVRTLDGGCTTPIGAYAEICHDKINLLGWYTDPLTGKCARGELTGERSESEENGKRLAQKIREQVS